MDSDRPIVIVGGGGHARVVAEAIGARAVVGHLSPGDDESTPSALGPRLGDDGRVAELAASGHAIALGLGFVDRAGALRRAELLDALMTVDDIELVSVCHERAIVSTTATLGAGSYVGPGAIVGTGTQLGPGAIVNSGAIVDHDCQIGRNAHVAPGVTLSGGVRVGEDTLVGVGTTIRQNVCIGARVVVGAGAVVLTDLPDGVTATGIPAQETT